MQPGVRSTQSSDGSRLWQLPRGVSSGVPQVFRESRATFNRNDQSVPLFEHVVYPQPRVENLRHDDSTDTGELKANDCKPILKELLKAYGIPKNSVAVSNGVQVTALMIRNVPCELHLEHLILQFEEAGYSSDFLYLHL